MSAVVRNISRYSDLISNIDRLRTATDTPSVALIMGRIDGVNTLNERFGYSIGDRVLAAFYDKFAAIARENDLALELSSNSFAFVVHAPRHESHVMLAADKIGRLAAEWVQIGESRVRLDICMGCALAETSADSSEQLLRHAEKALNDCRDSDRRAMIFKAQASENSRPASHPLFDAHKAIDNGEFRVHFQPQFDLRSGRLSGAEALVRWSGPDGLLAPGAFMSELERARAMIPLLQFVMNNTSREVARWVRRAPDLHVAINSSATDLEDTDLVDVLTDVLHMWNLEPARLTLEVTETSLMRDPEQGVATLTRLRELGVRTSIDDFGTGYSSLAWLKNLPVDELKIDRSFVQTVLDNPQDREIVKSVVSLAHAMGLKVVAEGIESEGIMQVVRDIGCDIGQGYYFGKPVTSAEFERCWLMDSNSTRTAEHAHG